MESILMRPPLGGHPQWDKASHVSARLEPTAIQPFCFDTGMTHHRSRGKHCNLCWKSM